ncbi:hypothetical protein T05_10439 [Trichinella murrelli]|uniref:Uncharacterized protein n=1 Tax=Trichinella murrelli TaxID=144512 RepID=A0A0V0T662_9BILA|nr:hypothetical protein T05_10439 [Trichinella murrelli]
MAKQRFSTLNGLALQLTALQAFWDVAGILMPIFSSRFCSELILGFSVYHGASLKAPTMSLDIY